MEVFKNKIRLWRSKESLVLTYDLTNAPHTVAGAVHRAECPNRRLGHGVLERSRQESHFSQRRAGQWQNKAGVRGPYQFNGVGGISTFIAVRVHEQLGVGVDWDEAFEVPLALNELHHVADFHLWLRPRAMVGVWAGISTGSRACEEHSMFTAVPPNLISFSINLFLMNSNTFRLMTYSDHSFG